MSSQSEDGSSIKPRELVFLLAIAGRIDAQSRILAQKLKKDRTIDHLYNIFDSLSSSYSMFKYFFEVFISNNNDPDLMRHILSSPQGIVLFTSEALFLVVFAFLASYFEKEEDKAQNSRDEIRCLIVMSWPYFRDMMKGMKNAYKGWRSAAQIIGLLSCSDLKHLVIPVGLALGGVATLSRFTQRYMEEQRRNKKTINNNVLKALKGLPFLTKKEHEFYLNRQQQARYLIKAEKGNGSALKEIKEIEHIQYQTNAERALDFLVRTLGGIIDSLYLYAGVISLTVLSPQAFLAMAIISAVYSFACVISRIYEGYEAQRELLATQTRCKLVLTSKELETTYTDFLNQIGDNNNVPLDQEAVKLMRQDLVELIKDFDGLRRELKRQITHSYVTAFLLGVKYGLFAYGVVTCFLFMATSVFMITAAVFPPVLLIAAVSSGLALIVGAILCMLKSHHHYLQEQKPDHEEPFYEIIKLEEKLVEDEMLVKAFPKLDSFKKGLENGSNLRGSPKSYVHEWLEIFRSLFSGIAKGNNFAGLISISLIHPDSQDHEHGPSAMLILTAASATIFAVILALRALGRGLGKDDNANDKAAPKTRDLRESSESATDSQKRNISLYSWYSYFRPAPKKIPTVTKQVQHSEYRVQGLT